MCRGAPCKTVGLAYVGSNPTPATIKTPGQARYRAILPVGLGSGLRYRCGYLEDREGSRVWPGRSVSASTLAENRMATVLLGVVELWLSQGLPQYGQDRGVPASAALICVPQPGVRREPTLEPVAIVTAPPDKTSASVC